MLAPIVPRKVSDDLSNTDSSKLLKETMVFCSKSEENFDFQGEPYEESDQSINLEFGEIGQRPGLKVGEK